MAIVLMAMMVPVQHSFPVSMSLIDAEHSNRISVECIGSSYSRSQA